VTRVKKTCLSVASVVGILLFVALFGFQIATALMVRYKARGIPEAYETPVPLRDHSISPTAHEQVMCSGYKFELPEDDIDDAASRSTGSIRVTSFRSGNLLWFSSFPARSFVGGVEKQMSVSTEDIRRSYGAEAAESDYGFNTVMLSITPAKISPFESSRQSARDSLLLMLKVTAVPRADTGLFSIQVNGWRGFQFGDPAKRPLRVTDELYSDDGGVDFIFFRKAGANRTISQSEINRVLASLRKVPRLPAELKRTRTQTGTK
jgi:hypothetical protein